MLFSITLKIWLFFRFFLLWEQTISIIPESDIFGIFPSKFLGFGVIGLALVLIILNLYDGIRKLANLEHHKLLTLFLILLYVILTIRVVEVAWYYRVS